MTASLLIAFGIISLGMAFVLWCLCGASGEEERKEDEELEKN